MTKKICKTSRLAALSALCFAGASLLLAGCGAGFGATDLEFGVGDSTAAKLEITTHALPTGRADAPITDVRLDVDGARGSVVWTVTRGALPDGVHISADGVLYGTPEEAGAFAFTVQAFDGRHEDTQDLMLAVDAFGLTVVSGLTFDEAWSDTPVTFMTAGATGAVDFEILLDPTQGHLLDNHGAPTATYVPGSAAGMDARVEVRATDRSSGRTAEITLRVQPSPIESHVARFGNTDVWYLDFELKQGTHAYAYDTHACLAALGLRNIGSTGSMGSEADQLADLVTRRAVLQEMNRSFLRNADGTQGPDGLGISFPFRRPASGYTYPAAGGVIPGGADRYSVLSLYDAAHREGFVGAALLDNSSNPNHVNNSASSRGGELGVFLNTLVDMVKSTYRLEQRSLILRPVDEDDVPMLRAMLFDQDLTPFGARGEDIRYTIWAISRSLSAVAGHEIGHSCGLGHNKLTVRGAIMNYATIVHPESNHHFLPTNIGLLRHALPGPGRMGAHHGKPTLHAQQAFLAEGGGLCLCRGK